MSDISDERDHASADDESRLEDLEREKEEFESRPHSGFADAVRVVRLESEIDALEENLTREKQRAEQGQG